MLKVYTGDMDKNQYKRQIEELHLEIAALRKELEEKSKKATEMPSTSKICDITVQSNVLADCRPGESVLLYGSVEINLLAPKTGPLPIAERRSCPPRVIPISDKFPSRIPVSEGSMHFRKNTAPKSHIKKNGNKSRPIHRSKIPRLINAPETFVKPLASPPITCRPGTGVAIPEQCKKRSWLFRYNPYARCPLFTNNDELHVDAVKVEAEKARKEVLDKNPGRKLKLDPTTKLPEPSRKVAKLSGNPAAQGNNHHHQRL